MRGGKLCTLLKDRIREAQSTATDRTSRPTTTTPSRITKPPPAKGHFTTRRLRSRALRMQTRRRRCPCRSVYDLMQDRQLVALPPLPIHECTSRTAGPDVRIL